MIPVGVEVGKSGRNVIIQPYQIDSGKFENSRLVWGVEEETAKPQESNLQRIWMFVIPVIVVAAIFILVQSTKPKEEVKTQVEGIQATNMQQELKIEDLKVGTGAEAVAGKTIAVHYLGTLTDGKKFESSYDSGQPLVFTLGIGRVIPGWDKGLVGMKEGGKRKLTIPPSMAYGETGSGPIPANATLIFEVELLKVE